MLEIHPSQRPLNPRAAAASCAQLPVPAQKFQRQKAASDNRQSSVEARGYKQRGTSIDAAGDRKYSRPERGMQSERDNEIETEGNAPKDTVKQGQTRQRYHSS